MANIITRLLLDASGYSGNLEKAQRSLDKYIDKNLSMNNVLTGITGTLGKVAGAVGVAMGAQEAFNKTINSTQTSGDFLRGTMESLKTSVDEFFYSVNTGNLSLFISQLGSIAEKGRAAYDALDQLGNTQISYGVLSAKNQSLVAEGQYLAKNKFAPIDKRIEGFGIWGTAIESEKQNIEALQNELINAATSAVESRLNANIEVTLQDLIRAFEVDLLKSNSRTEIKERAAQGARNYEVNAARADWTQKQKDDLAEIQRENIITYTMLQKYTDEELQDIANKIQQYYQLTNAVKGLGREYNETANEFNNANKKTKGFTPVSSLEGYEVYLGTNNGPKKDETKTTNPLEVQAFVSSGLNYTTQLGQKVMYAMQHDGVLPIIKQPIEIEETVDELPLPIDKKAVNEANDYATSLNAIANVMSAINGNTAEGAAGFLIWASNLATATATAIDAAKGMIAAKTAEGAASAGAEAAKTPFVGWLLVGGAIASALAAFASIPTFAEGGIVPGANFRDGVAARLSSGEMVINPADQKRLYDSIRGGNLGGGGRQKAVVTGEQIVLAVNNYGRSSGRGILIK